MKEKMKNKTETIYLRINPNKEPPEYVKLDCECETKEEYERKGLKFYLTAYMVFCIREMEGYWMNYGK